MDLALAVGVGPGLLSGLAPDGPLVARGSVVHLGLREDDPVLRSSGIPVLDLASLLGVSSGGGESCNIVIVEADAANPSVVRGFDVGEGAGGQLFDVAHAQRPYLRCH